MRKMICYGPLYILLLASTHYIPWTSWYGRGHDFMISPKINAPHFIMPHVIPKRLKSLHLFSDRGWDVEAREAN